MTYSLIARRCVPHLYFRLPKANPRLAPPQRLGLRAGKVSKSNPASLRPCPPLIHSLRGNQGFVSGLNITRGTAGKGEPLMSQPSLISQGWWSIATDPRRSTLRACTRPRRAHSTHRRGSERRFEGLSKTLQENSNSGSFICRDHSSSRSSKRLAL